MKKCIEAIFAVMLLTARAFGQGTMIWNESVNGEFSKDFNTPTSLSTLQLGSNSIVGMTEVVPTPPNWAGHPDFFTITVPYNSLVSAVYLEIDKPNVWAWIGEPTYLHELSYSLNPSSGELLAQLGLTSIGPGTYGMYLDNHDQQITTSVATYRLDFFVQVVPEPSTISLFLIGASLVLLRRRRQSKL